MPLRPSALLRPLRPLRSLVHPTTPRLSSAILPHTRPATIPPSIRLLPSVHNFSTTCSHPSNSDFTSNPVPAPVAQADQQSQDAGPAPPQRFREVPSYLLTFTCRPCQTRATHEISKQAYHKGSTLIQCPGCKARHVISDHLKIFGETARTFEEILAEKGMEMKHLRMDENGDVEILPPPEKSDYVPPAETDEKSVW